MDNLIGSAKKIKIDKNQRSAMIAVGLAAFVLVFTGFFSYRMYKNMRFQADVICELNVAGVTIRQNDDNLTKLKTSFDKFNTSNSYVLGSKEKQGSISNSVVVSRALPNRYWEPEMNLTWTTFYEAGNGTGLVVAGEHQGYEGEGAAFTGVVGGGAEEENAVSSELQEVAFTLNVNLQSVEELNQLLKDLDNFIMPVKIKGINLVRTPKDSIDAAAKYGVVDISLQTYFQGEKLLEVVSDTIDPNATKRCKETD